jgi:prepilin peptidase CpaA
MIIAAIFLVLPLCFALAALTDLFTMTIPNRVPVILLLSFLVIAPLSGMDWQSFGLSLLAGIAVLLVCFGLFALNTMGGGDAKLLAASAVWFGLNTSLATFLISVAMVGGILAISILLLRSRSQEILAIGIPVPDSLLVASKIPYGIAIAIGGLLTYPETPIAQAAIRALI